MENRKLVEMVAPCDMLRGMRKVSAKQPIWIPANEVKNYLATGWKVKKEKKTEKLINKPASKTSAKKE